MKAAIIVFSTSGNTNKAAQFLQKALVENNMEVQLINITGNKEYFAAENKRDFLEKMVKEHDFLFVGGPVFARHLQYHVIELIKSLPVPASGWGKTAVPFVTYGGIESGIALKEAGDLLNEGGRKVLAGLKISAPHNMTGAFMNDVYNKEQNEEEVISVINELVTRIKSADIDAAEDCSKYLNYQSESIYLEAVQTGEKIWHDQKYPKIIIEQDMCTKCGKCVKVCPVCCLQQDDNQSIISSSDSACIHCFNCIMSCSRKAIHPSGDASKAKDFMESLFRKGKETPAHYLYSDYIH